MSESVTQWYVKQRLNKPVIVFFKDRNETFSSVQAASLSLEVEPSHIMNSIVKGTRLKTPFGIVCCDWLEFKN